MEKSNRIYGIDLLRLILMFMVCMLHVLNNGGVIEASKSNFLNYIIYLFVDVSLYCAVDGFAIISGYVATDAPKKYEKIVEMWFQAFFYSFILSFVLFRIGGTSFSSGKLLLSALPILSNQFWYFTAYFALYFTMPILNKYLFSISETTAKRMFLLLLFLFSISNFLFDEYKTQYGYSYLWLCVLYCLGVLTKKIKLFESKSNKALVLLLFNFITITWLMFILGFKFLKSYTSPTIVFIALILIILFSRIKIKGNIISKISPLAFGIYLFHSNPIIWNDILKNAFIFVGNKNILIGLCYIFSISFFIFLTGLIVEFFRYKIARIIKIPLFSKAIVNELKKVIDSLSEMLK